MDASPPTQHPSALERLLGRQLRLDGYALVWVALILLAVLSRFSDLETRVMSHDESEHTYFSWLLAEGRGYQHSPITHGPLQFHLIALSYTIFGDSDSAARVPVAAAGVIAIAMLCLFRPWLGRWGSLAAAALMLVSPYMLYYQRYVRNEAYVVVEALLLFLAVFRYFETRQSRWLYLTAAALTLHILTKETSFIYAVELMAFLGMDLVLRMISHTWKTTRHKAAFLFSVTAMLAGGGASLYVFFRDRAMLAQPGQAAPISVSPIIGVGLIVAILGLAGAATAAIQSIGRRLLTDFPSLELLVVCITVTLPQFAAFPAVILGWDPIDYNNPATMLKTGLVLVILILLTAILLALLAIATKIYDLRPDWWRWPVVGGIFIIPFTIFYTTFFTTWMGFLTGIVGSLGYWLAQQEVNRGGQPWYYYLFPQIPLYEFLPAIGSLLAAGYGVGALLRRVFRQTVSPQAGESPISPEYRVEDLQEAPTPSEPSAPPAPQSFPGVLFLGFWSLSSLAMFSFAGERMPWLTVHIALPLILLAGWAFGRLLEKVEWARAWRDRSWLALFLLVIFALTTARALRLGLTTIPQLFTPDASPSRSGDLFLAALSVALISGTGLWFTIRRWEPASVGRLATAIAVGLLFLQTARTAYRAAYINHDRASEFLVYAHSATGVKTVLSQLEEFSQRSTGGLDLDFAYDSSDGKGDSGVSWPFTWYVRRFTRAHSFGPEITRSLLDNPVILVSDNNRARLEALVGPRFVMYEYIRMWWPMQDYWGLTWERIRNALTNPEWRAALWRLWFDRDYTLYGQLNGVDYSLEHWPVSDRMYLYIRKDVAAQVWSVGGTAAALQPIPPDPYAAGMRDLPVDVALGGQGSTPGQMMSPRAIAVAEDGSLYVADSRNHRVQHLSPTGEVLHVWGEFGAIENEIAPPPGKFNEPWGIAVGPDGSVYVADTWNNRIQKFTPEGEFLAQWDRYDIGGTTIGFYGPRAIAFDGEGRVYVADTGNKRIVVFSAEGDYLTHFGSPGNGPGELNEPVGIAISPDGTVYVADTWNLRVQAFRENELRQFQPTLEWGIDGWYGESLENKPFLAIPPDGGVCATDPEGYRVLCFSVEGEFKLGWQAVDAAESPFNLPTGIAFDADGGVWVSDSGSARLLHFAAPLAGLPALP